MIALECQRQPQCNNEVQTSEAGSPLLDNPFTGLWDRVETLRIHLIKPTEGKLRPRQYIHHSGDCH